MSDRNEDALIRLHEMIADSRVFLGLFNEDYKRDPTALVQLVFAVMLEKPIYLLVPRGVRIPRGLRRLADGIEEYDDSHESLERATERLINVARNSILKETTHGEAQESGGEETRRETPRHDHDEG